MKSNGLAVSKDKDVYKRQVYDIKDKIKNMDLWKKLIFLFLFVCIMSYLFSPYKSVAFLGHGGRYRCV